MWSMTIVHELDLLVSAKRLSAYLETWPGVISAVPSPGPRGAVLSVVMNTSDITLVDRVRRRITQIDPSARQTYLSPPAPIPGDLDQSDVMPDIA